MKDSEVFQYQPPFLFRIDEMNEHPSAPHNFDNEGNWIPWTNPGWNVRNNTGVSTKWWFCDRQTVQHCPNWAPPNGAIPYKVFSTFFSGGHGFWVLRGDATHPADDETWHRLLFDHNNQNYSSSLTNAGTQRTLRCQQLNAWWPHMLLPDIYHGPLSPHSGYGGLTGDLPIFLSLLAFSMQPDQLVDGLPGIMQNGDWAIHHRQHGRTDKRGVIVYVYPYQGNDTELRDYEDGIYGKYYN